MFLTALVNGGVADIRSRSAPYVMNRAAFGSEPSEIGPGNVFEPMPEWNQITGGWRRKRKEVLRRTALAGGAALAPLLAYWLIRRQG